MKKIIVGFVLQEWDDEKKEFSNQDFISDDCVQYEDDEGDLLEGDVPGELLKAYLPMNMVQPGDAEFCQQKLQAELAKLKEAADWDVVNALAELDVRTAELAEAKRQLADTQRIKTTMLDCLKEEDPVAIDAEFCQQKKQLEIVEALLVAFIEFYDLSSVPNDWIDKYYEFEDIIEQFPKLSDKLQKELRERKARDA